MVRKKILFICDGVTPTGFSTVAHGIIGNLPRKQFEVHHLAVNYNGDPHDYDWKIYPAMIGGDYLGINRIKNTFCNMQWDGIFILNDIWVINNYLKTIKESFKTIPPIIIYFPVDSKALDKSWAENFDIVTKVCVYTKFGFDELYKVYDEKDINIVPHGLNQAVFFKVPVSKEEVRKAILPNSEEYYKGFIVLSANRNQPRKRLDITIEGFSIFAKDKPIDVKLYLHCGLKDAGIDILKLTSRYGIDNRLILTNMNRSLQAIPPDRLNLIYNIADVGINTSTGEGWSLTNMEHAVTGAPQVVPNHSALPELFHDTGIIVPINQEITSTETLTIGGLVKPEDVASALDRLYTDKILYEKLSKRAYEKFSNEKYSWNYITNNQWLPILEDAYDI